METQSLEQAGPPFLAGLDGLILYEDVGTGMRAKQGLEGTLLSELRLRFRM